jgi:hypothetical protein
VNRLESLAANLANATAFLAKVLEDWLGYLSARNLTSHTYNQAIAAEVYAVIDGGFLAAAEGLI